MKVIVLIASVFILWACQNQKDVEKSDNVEEPISEKKVTKIALEDGIYLLLDELNDTSRYSGNGQIIEYNHDFLDSTLNEDSLFLAIDPNEFIHLTLAKEPEGIEQEDQRINLMLTLSDAASNEMAEFTEKHVGGKIALVIGGKAYTKHKIREKITAGKLQITRCFDDACQHLLVELKDNYSN